jgi:steroid 5-alpha reductase family enzyme
MLAVMATAAVAVAALMLGTWLASLWRRDASIVDIVWGPGFALVAWSAFVVGDGYGPRSALITLMATLWGLRLGAYLLWRKRGEGEDFRYRRMRARWGDRFGVVSLATVFALQGALMWLISLPLQVAQVSGDPGRLTLFDFAGLAVWSVGLTFEALGDWQLARFKANPENEGKVMDRGLWRYTRHPNYFGDALVWWGIFLVALARLELAWTVISPIAMTFLLVRVSGVPLLERSLVKRRPGYAEYVARTSAFIPRPPRSGSAAPGSGTGEPHEPGLRGRA